jgi:hypothetical protein
LSAFSFTDARAVNLPDDRARVRLNAGDEDDLGAAHSSTSGAPGDGLEAPAEVEPDERP